MINRIWNADVLWILMGVVFAPTSLAQQLDAGVLGDASRVTDSSIAPDHVLTGEEWQAVGRQKIEMASIFAHFWVATTRESILTDHMQSRFRELSGALDDLIVNTREWQLWVNRRYSYEQGRALTTAALTEWYRQHPAAAAIPTPIETDSIDEFIRSEALVEEASTVDPRHRARVITARAWGARVGRSLASIPRLQQAGAQLPYLSIQAPARESLPPRLRPSQLSVWLGMVVCPELAPPLYRQLIDSVWTHPSVQRESALPMGNIFHDELVHRLAEFAPWPTFHAECVAQFTPAVLAQENWLRATVAGGARVPGIVPAAALMRFESAEFRAEFIRSFISVFGYAQ